VGQADHVAGQIGDRNANHDERPVGRSTAGPKILARLPGGWSAIVASMSPTDDGATSRFEIRVDPAFRALFTILGAGRHHDYVEVGATALRVRLGWLFVATVPRSAVGQVVHHADMYGGWGAHGWRGRWLVNGSSKGIVEIDLTVRQRAHLLGGWPISLSVLYVSFVDPDGFLTALG
jgi:hypothetical protein